MKLFKLANAQGCIFDSTKKRSLDEAIRYFSGAYVGPFVIDEYDETGMILFSSSNVNLENVSAAAAALGRKGGSAKTESKQAASRENGKKGGRPKKIKDESPKD